MIGSRFVDKNITEAIERFKYASLLLTVSSYEIHQKKLKDMRYPGVKGRDMVDEEAEILKFRIINNKLKSHEFTENGKQSSITIWQRK